MPPRRWWKNTIAPLVFALAIVVTILFSTGSGRKPTGAADTFSQPSGSGPAWMRRLAPGEKPPQFVLFSFDGAGSHEHFARVLPIARNAGAHFSAFLSGIYLLSDDEKTRYRGPGGHKPGTASIDFGGPPDEVATRIRDLNAARRAGNEIGTHYNGHFCRGESEPSVAWWSTAEWTDELNQFFGFVDASRKKGLEVADNEVKGGRTPCLEGRFDQLFPALRDRGMTYDSSQVSDGIVWPTKQRGIWEFPLPEVRTPALRGKKVIMMDYNLWVSFNGGKDDPSRRDEFRKATLDVYWAAYRAALNGNRAPLVVGNHFNDWAGGAFSGATEEFMGTVCTRPETVCATYSEVVEWLARQDPAQVARWQELPNAQVE